MWVPATFVKVDILVHININCSQLADVTKGIRRPTLHDRITGSVDGGDFFYF